MSDSLDPREFQRRSVNERDIFRELGGHLTATGHRVREGQIYRVPMFLLDPALGAGPVPGLNLRALVDLRTPAELLDSSALPNVLPPTVHYRRVSLSGKSTVFDTLARPNWTDYVENYRRILRRAAQPAAEVLREIAEERLPLAFGCTLGKDRTSIVSAILLALLGVPDEAIAGDYVRTGEFLLGHASRFGCVSSVLGLSQAELRRRCSSTQAETMKATLESLRIDYGGASCFMRRAGISLLTIDAARTHLLV